MAIYGESIKEGIEREIQKRAYQEALYRMKYDYVYDPDPRLREFMDPLVRKKIKAIVREKGQVHLSDEERGRYELLKRYERNKFTKQWFTTTLATIRDCGKKGYFEQTHTTVDTNDSFFQEAGRLLELVIPLFVQQAVIEATSVEKVETLLDRALENFFPGKKKKQIERVLKIKPSIPNRPD